MTTTKTTDAMPDEIYAISHNGDMGREIILVYPSVKGCKKYLNADLVETKSDLTTAYMTGHTAGKDVVTAAVREALDDLEWELMPWVGDDEITAESVYEVTLTGKTILALAALRELGE